MSNPTPSKSSMDHLTDSYLHELVQMPDEDVLEGVDRKATASIAAGLLQRAKTEAGRRRLNFAKAGVKATGEPSQTTKAPISISEARAYIQQASNDSRFTLAARGLEEMSDEDLMHLYQQIKELEAIASRGSKS